MARPNIILIYTDQQRYDTLGVNGNNLIKTPNIDRLAAEGVNFTRAYTTCPICVPSRVSLFTARYSHTNRSWSNGRLMFADETDLVSVLKDAGYTTALIGKDHCFTPERKAKAFDFVCEASHCAIHDPEDDAERRVNDLRRPTMQKPMVENPLSPDEDITGHLFRHASEYIEREHEKPFFMWFSIPDPHPPYMVCEPYASMYDDVDIPLPKWREDEMADKPYKQRCVVEWDRYNREYPTDADIRRLKSIYWGMVTYIDDELGKFMERINATGLDEDTIFLFTTDHGDYMGDHHMIRKGPHVYEALTHIPQIVRWKGHIEPHTTDAFTENIDIMPTLYDLAGIDLPDGVQGRSFRQVLTGESDSHRPMVFLEHGEDGEPITPDTFPAEEYGRLKENTSHHLCREITNGYVKGVRTDRWKYCVTPGDIDELYDLESDPDELYNHASKPEHAETVREHQRYILDWMIRTQDAKKDDKYN